MQKGYINSCPLPIKNRPSRICHNIWSKSVRDEKYIRPHEIIASILISTTIEVEDKNAKIYFVTPFKLKIYSRVNRRPIWSRIVADKIPPRGHMSVFKDATQKIINHNYEQFRESLQAQSQLPNQLACSSFNFIGLLSFLSSSSVIAGNPIKNIWMNSFKIIH